MTLMFTGKKIGNCSGVRKLKHIQIEKGDKEVM
jgi:hypothetical protein